MTVPRIASYDKCCFQFQSWCINNSHSRSQCVLTNPARSALSLWSRFRYPLCSFTWIPVLEPLVIGRFRLKQNSVSPKRSTREVDDEHKYRILHVTRHPPAWIGVSQSRNNRPAHSFRRLIPRNPWSSETTLPTLRILLWLDKASHGWVVL